MLPLSRPVPACARNQVRHRHKSSDIQQSRAGNHPMTPPRTPAATGGLYLAQHARSGHWRAMSAASYSIHGKEPAIPESQASSGAVGQKPVPVSVRVRTVTGSRSVEGGLCAHQLRWLPPAGKAPRILRPARSSGSVRPCAGPPPRHPGLGADRSEALARPLQQDSMGGHYKVSDRETRPLPVPSSLRHCSQANFAGTLPRRQP